jgi:hypothetical protein
MSPGTEDHLDRAAALRERSLRLAAEAAHEPNYPKRRRL